MDAIKQPSKDKMFEQWKRNAIAWKFNKEFTPDGMLPFDIGSSCNRGINAMKNNSINPYANDETHIHNGGLMRILPLVFLDIHSEDEILHMISLFNSCSHNQTASHISCLLYIRIEQNILANYSLKDSIIKAIRDDIKEQNKIFQMNRLWNMNILSAPVEEIRSAGDIIDTIESVIWCLYQSDDYVSAVLKAVNLGHDTDTIAALVGGLAGLYYGKSSILEIWVSKLQRLQLLLGICE